MIVRVSIFCFVLLNAVIVFGQATLPLSRTTWNAGAPLGWTDGNGGTPAYTSSFACSGSNGGRLDFTAEYYLVYFSDSPDVLTYTIKVSGVTTSSLLVEESVDNITFSTVVNHTSLPTGCTTYNYTLSPSSRYVKWTYTKVSENLTIDDVSITKVLSCTPAAQPTVNSSNLSFPDTTCSSIDLSWTNGDGANRIVVASTSPIAGTPVDQTNYNANASFGSGSTIAANEYVVYNGSLNSLTVTNLNASTTYYFAIFEYNGVSVNCTENYLTSSVLTGSFTTPSCPIQTCSEITGILVDACGGANEGINEFFTFTNGANTLSVDSLTANFPSGGSFCNSGCGAQTWVTNPAYVSSLNTTAACPGLFVEVNPIPANANVIVFTGQTPTYNFDFSGLCGTGPYYSIFANNTNIGGRFANYAACTSRTLTVSFGTSCSDTVNYDRCLLANSDGAYVAYDASGNAVYDNDGCTPIELLPITLINFKGKAVGSSNILEWETSIEINNDYFTIERSNDAFSFNEIGTQKGSNNSTTTQHYKFIDDKPHNGISYYRLKQTDYNGESSYSSIISIDNFNVSYLVWNTLSSLFIKSEIDNEQCQLFLYNCIGKLVLVKEFISEAQINTTQFPSGFYLVKIKSSNSLFSKKVRF